MLVGLHHVERPRVFVTVERRRPDLLPASERGRAIGMQAVDLLNQRMSPPQDTVVRVALLVARDHGTIFTLRWSLATTRPFFTMYTSM
jgi:hypothetical protein